MRTAPTLMSLVICLTPLSVAHAKPINSAMAFAAAVLENDQERAVAMISGTVEQVSRVEFLPGEKPSGERFFAALEGCKFTAVFDEMPSANFSPHKRSIEVSWLCGDKSVRVNVEPLGEKVRLKYLKAMPMIGAPPASPANVSRERQ